MARYKDTAKGQGLFMTVDLEEQIVPDTYEFTLKHLIDDGICISFHITYTPRDIYDTMFF